MFNNLKMYLVNSNDALVYNDAVAGLFSDYRITSNSGVHLIEDRKLTDNEMDKFLDHMDSEDIEDESDTEPQDIQEMLHKIVKYHPEVKYAIHGFNIALAATPQRIEKKKQKMIDRKAAKQKKKEEQRKSREIKEEPVEEKPKKEVTPIDVDYGKEEPKETSEEPAVTEKPKAKEKKIKPIDVDYGNKDEKKSEESEESEPSEKEKANQEKIAREKEGERKRLEEEEKMKQDRQDKEKQPEDEALDPGEGGKYSKVGKEPKFDGFLGLMFKMFKGLADPKKKADKEELRRKLKRDYATYKKNEKFLKENTELIDMLNEKIAKKEFDLDSISILNEIISRDPSIVDELGLDKNSTGPITKKVPLLKLTEELKDLKIDPSIDESEQERRIKEIFKKHKIDVKDVAIGLGRDGKQKIAEVELGGLDSLMKFMNALSLKHGDILK